MENFNSYEQTQSLMLPSDLCAWRGYGKALDASMQWCYTGEFWVILKKMGRVLTAASSSVQLLQLRKWVKRHSG